MSAEFNHQLQELTVRLCSVIAEKLAYVSQNLEGAERLRVTRMIEDDLPTVVSNTIAKTLSLHSAKGVEWLEQNLDSMADTYCRKFMGRE
jgi:hypothetical protein